MPEFNDLVIETIEEVIRNVFKDDIADIIFRHLERSNPKPFDKKIQIFSEALPKILGIGHTIIEDLILETLYAKCKVEIVWRKKFSFTDYVRELRKRKLERERTINEPVIVI